MIEDHSAKAALAQDIFGRAGTALIPMIDTYKQLGDELERMGGIMSNEAVEAAEKLKDDMEDLERATTALAANSGFIEWLSDISGGLNDILKSAKPIEDFFRNLIESTADSTIGKVIPGLGLAAKGAKALGLGVKETETGAITEEELAEEKARIAKREEMQTLKDEINDQLELRAAITEQSKEDIKLMAEADKLIASQNKELEKQDELLAGFIKENEDFLKEINEVSAEKPTTAGVVTQDDKALTDRITRIGGSIGGRGDVVDLDKKRNNLLGKLVKLYEKNEKEPFEEVYI